MSIIFAAALLAAGCAMQKDVYSSAMHDMPEDAKYEFGPGYARYSDPDMRVEISYLSPAALDLYFSRFRGGKFQNPILPRSFIAFSLEIENTGGTTVTFNPRMTHLVTEKKRPLAATDYSSFYADLSLAGDEDVDERVTGFRAACYDTGEIVEPGGRVHKIIVFPRTAEVSSGAVMLLNGLYVGHKPRPVGIQYNEDISLPEE